MKNSENDNNSKDIEVPLNIFESHLIEAINKVEGFSYGDIKYLNKYPNEISEKVLILLFGAKLCSYRVGEEKNR